MIHTAKQLKDKVRNQSCGNSDIAQALIRNFMMERFLERVSFSRYRNNFVLKGGMLVASIVGVDMRATMDIDTTVRALPLKKQEVKRIIEEIYRILENVENDTGLAEMWERFKRANYPIPLISYIIKHLYLR